MAAVTATRATEPIQSPTKKPPQGGFFLGESPRDRGGVYLRGRLNQLASMNRQKTANMMMRMCLISMVSPWVVGRGEGLKGS